MCGIQEMKGQGRLPGWAMMSFPNMKPLEKEKVKGTHEAVVGAGTSTLDMGRGCSFGVKVPT